MSLFEDDILDDDINDYDDSQNHPHGVSEHLNPPQSSDLFFYHNEIEQNILNLWQNNSLPHALVFNGIKGIGKATFAYRLARFVLSQSNDDASQSAGLFGEEETQVTNMDVLRDSTVFSKVASGGHPDILVVGRPFDEKKGQYRDDIPVDDIRKVAPFLRKTSSNGGWRIVIVDDANCMNRNGQNAILKILEEPPKKTLLILVTHGVGGLLPTIRSRCRFVEFSALDTQTIEMLLRKTPSGQNILGGDMDIITSMADGSAGKAIELLDEGGIESLHLLLGALTQINEMSIDQLNILALSYAKSGGTSSVKQFIEGINWWFSQLVAMALENKTNLSIGAIDVTRPMHYDLPTILTKQEECIDMILRCDTGTIDKHYMIYKILRILQHG